MWYEIAHKPNFFEKSESAYATASYELLVDGAIGVLNTSYNALSIPIDAIEGRATISGPYELMVNFGFGAAQYKIEYLREISDKYDLSIVGNDQKTQLWILARTQITPNTLRFATDMAQKLGYDVRNLIINTPTLTLL